MQAISSTNVVAAALIVQVWLSTSFFLTAHLHKDSLPSITFARSDGVEKYPNFLFAILSVTLFNIVLILLSADMYRLWGPVFGDAPLHTISEASTLMLVFSINLFLAAYLVSMTSGSQQSPFTPAVFTLPSLAIFLRMTPVFFVPYSVFAAIIYLVFLYLGGSKRSAESGGRSARRSSAAFMALSCLMLTIIVGYITRPIG
ncbi:MAG: hypothetical protein M0Z99_22155 [Betaproteobacteria bacterium]|nr:hypothetical protein [Betaproteobacteria bacterium]